MCVLLLGLLGIRYPARGPPLDRLSVEGRGRLLAFQVDQRVRLRPDPPASLGELVSATRRRAQLCLQECLRED